jgi:diguanylate cyclase (GGDEF)-like protein
MPTLWSHRVSEPRVLFPLIAVVGLAVIWGTTLNLIKVERGAAERAAAVSSRELAETYEAQVVRALREIDQTLKVVKYAHERRGAQAVLQDMKARALLPPDRLFIVYVVDSKGDVVASSRPSPITTVADRDYFLSLREADILSIGLPRQRPGSEEWRLIFGRRLNGDDGEFAGIVMVVVDAAYFVSAYETSKLGEHGMLGLLGTDGVFRARRSGEKVSAGERIAFPGMKLAADNAPHVATPSTDALDGVLRYTTVRLLYDFPLAVVVGLSAGERLAPARRQIRAHLWKASFGSLALILVLATLGRMSAQLALSRRRATQEHIAYAARAEYLAYHDTLTTLANRSLFSKLLGQSLQLARRYDRRLAVLFLDLDGFKRVNDSHGHEVGDQLLQEVAARLKACLRDSDTVARLGGDEFTALLPELAEDKYAATVAKKVLAALARPFVLNGKELRVTASVGISLYPQDGTDEQTLMKNADVAMYRAKDEGKNNFQFYSEELNASALERQSLESGLRLALERSEFQLHYQPKRDIRSGRITGMEALLRWQHPDLGTVAPLRFIPVAEETGLIVAIGKWVLLSACRQNVAWQDEALPRVSVSVNLTARQFADKRLLADLAAILAETGMDAHLLELEISEGLLMRDLDRALGILTGLKSMGIRIAIDDFGLGYASLATLQRFPLDTIKIDRSFIRDVGGVDDHKEVTEAIIAMGRKLSLTIVAQGVETKEQAEFLRRNACDEFQGFYLGKPAPADEIAKLLRDQSIEDGQAGAEHAA